MSPKNEPTKRYRFEILRYDAAAGEGPRFQPYDVSAEPATSVLEVLLRIQDEQDPTLAFRYACRGAVCGSCAMSINGKLDLACRVRLRNLHTDRVVLEPLPHFEILKDLVVDMDPFWHKYERVQPWLHAGVSQAAESRMTVSEREKIDQYVNCILCGICLGACPVLKSNPEFTGPAALAKLYRFVADAREGRRTQSLEQEDGEQGMWGCRTVGQCTRACPKNVRPSDGIRAVRRRLLVHKLKHVFSKAPK